MIYHDGDRFPKQQVLKAQASKGVRGQAPSGNCLDFNSFQLTAPLLF